MRSVFVGYADQADFCVAPSPCTRYTVADVTLSRWLWKEASRCLRAHAALHRYPAWGYGV